MSLKNCVLEKVKIIYYIVDICLETVAAYVLIVS